MRWIELAKLELEDLNSDTDFSWALEPKFFRIEETGKDDKEAWSVSVYHRHWSTTKNPSNSPPHLFRCGLVNREEALTTEALTTDAFPEYECDKCGKSVPRNMVEEKMERLRSLKGVDPRNDRRGAVLATRENSSITTKES